MIRAAIVGFGNIGHFVLEAVLASPDIEAAGIVSRSLEQKDVGGIPVAREVSELKDVDVAILWFPQPRRAGSGGQAAGGRDPHGRQL